MLKSFFNRQPQQPAPKYRIAITGAGIAGLAAAIFLKRSGHDITLFEKAQKPGPVGAGFLLQPIGLHVLDKLGVKDEVIARGSVVHALEGRLISNDKKVLDVRYDTLSKDLFGLGIHRGNIFSALMAQVQALGIPVVAGSDIAHMEKTDKGSTLTDASGENRGTFDLVVDGTGLRSKLRPVHAQIKTDKPYPYGALWAVVDNNADETWDHALLQKYTGATTMIGTLPVGERDASGKTKVALFYSIKVADYDTWLKTDFATWKTDTAKQWPEAASFINQLQNHQQMTFARYSDVVLHRFDGKGIVFIGDSAHATSPQLGQGANMALVDAMTLDARLTKQPDLQKALAEYSDARQSQMRFYQFASRQTTPFFQGDSKLLPKLRDIFMGVACKTPFIKHEMSKTLCGFKTGLFRQKRV